MSVPREASDFTSGDIIDRPNWFALCTNPKQEDRACSNLESWGVECFNPKSLIDKNGFLHIGEPLKPGDKIRIKSELWQGLVGVVERNLTASERVLILMTTIGYQGRLTVDRDMVEKLS